MSTDETALQRQVIEDLNEITAIGGNNSFVTLPGLNPFASVGNGLPVRNHPVVRSSRSVRGRQSPIDTRAVDVRPRYAGSVRR